MAYKVLYDEPQEALWFKNLHHELVDADEIPLGQAADNPRLNGVLGYDRPDVVLLRDARPILVVEETVEVPSGHNVGQRFARLAAAAEHQVPCLYFGPYKAKKHGGETAGPRYMNLRLFGALDAMTRVTGTAMTTINWPVDSHCEVRRDRAKDDDVREYMETLLAIDPGADDHELNRSMLASAIHTRTLEERDQFARTVVRSDQYDLPPNSVEFLTQRTFEAAHKINPRVVGLKTPEIVLYNVGMRKIRSDPYTGMAMLYHYLYIAEHPDRSLVLWFPNITEAMWRQAARNPRRKDVRLYKHSAEAILFRDALVRKADL
jgi:hypothetical protein